jgi:hypothetical protein
MFFNFYRKETQTFKTQLDLEAGIAVCGGIRHPGP